MQYFVYLPMFFNASRDVISKSTEYKVAIKEE